MKNGEYLFPPQGLILDLYKSKERRARTHTHTHGHDWLKKTLLISQFTNEETFKSGLSPANKIYT